MKKALLKDTFREVKNTFSRFISIFAIVAIGVGFFAGIKASGPDMKLTANQYYQDYNLADMRLLSTMGFNEKDVNAIKKTPGVNQVSASNFLDVFIEKNNSKEEIRIHTLSNPITINNPWVVEGRLPKKSGECVVEVAFLNDGMYQIGDTIKLLPDNDTELTDTLRNDKYTIVGTVNSPQYISYDRGNSTIGNGTIDYYILIPATDFLLDYYTEIFILSEKTPDLFSYSDEYDDMIHSLQRDLKATANVREAARYEEIIAKANEKLQDGIEELHKGKKELQDGINKANNEFSKAQKQIDQGYSTLKRERASFEKKINTAQSSIDKGLTEIEQGEIEYEKGYSDYLQGKKALEEAKIYLDANKDFMSQEEHSQAMEEYNLRIVELKTVEETLIATKEQLESSKISLDLGQEELTKQKSMGIAQMTNAKKDLEEGQRKLNTQKKEFEREIADSQKKLDEAQQEISDAEDEIFKLEKPTWYVNTRDDQPGYTEFGQNADRIDAIARVFPVFFLLVAALVSLTTMTRMVEEQRTHIGTLKALGYSKFSIISKYFIYANFASTTGSIVGLLIGFQLFPWVIFSAYGIMYELPPVISPFHYDFAFVSILAAILCTSLSVLLACNKELHALPASLMRPKSPKAGKRVFLEKIPFLWKQFSFSSKVTARNLFRYKKRMFMTVIGISGCTALMLTGFGVKDSISNISEIQFNELLTYDFITVTDEDSETTEVEERLTNHSNMNQFISVHFKSVDATNEKEKYAVNLFVPQDVYNLDDFIKLRTYGEKRNVKISNDGVVITLKLSRLLDKEIGDEIIIKDSDGKETPVKIAGITENYISHYIYMSPTLYKQTFQEEAKYNAILGDMKDTSLQYENEISEELLKFDSVVGLSFTQNHIATFNDMIVSLNFVVLVLIISASLLAFVVLYNLTNINVNERLREIATIKVLGFYDNEVSAYIYRENMVLTFMGTLAGFGLGVLLHQFVIQTAEVNDLMFGRTISLPSYIISGILTIVFALCVNVVLHFKLKKIDMVESLKSVE